MFITPLSAPKNEVVFVDASTVLHTNWRCPKENVYSKKGNVCL